MIKKILYVITKSNWGGAQRYVFDLAADLPKDRFEAAVACGGNGIFIQKLKEKGIRVLPIPNLERNINIRKEILSLFSLWRIFRKERPDIIHLNSSKVGGLGALAARLAGIPKIVFTAHGWPFNEDRNMVLRFIIWFLCWLTAIFCHEIIVITQKDLASARKFPFVPIQKIHYIPNGIAENGLNFMTREGSCRELNLSINSSTVLIGNTTEFTKNKGNEYLIRALANLPEKFELALIGDGEEKYNLKTLAGNLGLEGRVHFLGFKDQASHYLKAFDIFVNPSIKEGLPYVILEAGLAGIPVIASNVGGIPDIITSDENGILVEPKNPTALIEAIEKLDKSPELQKKFSKNLSQKIKTEFNFEKMINRTLKIYDSM